MVDATSSFSSSVFRSLAQNGTSWIVNPPNAPHFGGLWEAAVKSAKRHLRRVIGDQVFTFSELTTLMCRIEACLNSRPLIALTDDPSDLEFLSPSHCLIQRSSFLVSEDDLTDANVPPGKRWLLISQLNQHFRARWSSEYLNSQYSISAVPFEVTQQKCSVAVDDLVSIRNELTLPAKWLLARVIAIHPGSDGITRVIDLRIATTTVRRPIAKVVRLRPTD